MQLFSLELCLARTVKMLLVSNLLMWEIVVSVPMHASWAGHGQMSLNDELDDAITLSYNITNLTAEMHRIFMEDVRHRPGRWFPERELIGCQTSALAILMPKEGTQQMPGVFLLKELMSILGTWKHPLYYIVTELSRLEDVPHDIISRAKDIEAKTQALLEALKRILSKIQPGFPESEAYPVWRGLASLQSPDEEIRHLALFNLFQCLTKDSRKVYFNLRLLKCRLVYNTDC